MRFRTSKVRPRLETLEDRTLMSACHVGRLADLDGGHDLGNGHLRGTLRYCINHANANPGPDTIDFRVTGTILLTSKLPQLASDITITGPGADLLAVDGNIGGGIYGPIFDVLSGATVNLSGLTITNGRGYSEPGGIYNKGTLMLKDSTVSNNTHLDGCSCGGGIRNNGNMTISGSTISGNNVEITETEERGGGIFNSGVMNILNSTISGNTILGAFNGKGGGIYNFGTSSLDIRSSTITQNGGTSGITTGGIYNQAGVLNLQLNNTIVAGNTSAFGDPNLSSGYTGSENLIGGDPMLGPLAYNGGHTQTHAVLPGSPAIDAGDNDGAPAFDQRGPGFPRIVNGIVDIGAFEVQTTNAPGAGRTLILRRVSLIPPVLIMTDLDNDQRGARGPVSEPEKSP